MELKLGLDEHILGLKYLTSLACYHTTKEKQKIIKKLPQQIGTGIIARYSTLSV